MCEEINVNKIEQGFFNIMSDIVISELKSSWPLDWVSGIFCNWLNFEEIPRFKCLLLVDIHVMRLCTLLATM